MTEKFNIEYELKLLELLGFRVTEQNAANRMIIVDSNDVEVGYIERKKINKGYPIEYGYIMEINNGKIIYNGLRKEEDYSNNLVKQPLSYTFYAKSYDGSQDRIYISLGEKRTFKYQSDKHGYAELKVSKDQLYLNFYRPMVNPSMREIIAYDNFGNMQGRYSYKIIYGEQERHIEDEYNKTAIFEISGIHNSTMKDNQLEIQECIWLDGEETERIHSQVMGTIPEMALKHENGIATFNYFIDFIKVIMPFSQNIVAAIFDDAIKNSHLNIFMKNIKSESKKLILENKEN